MPEMSRRAPAEGRNKDRAWDKCMAEVGYSLRGLHAFISALRALYRADSRQMCLLDPSPHHHSETVSPSDLFFFNLCEHAHIEAARADIARVSGAAAADLALADGSIYRTLLSSGLCFPMDRLFAHLTDRDRPTGWVVITGVPGSGLASLVQQVAAKWGEHEKLWHDRFDFVFRVRLSLLADEGPFDGGQDPGDPHEGSCRRLARLIHRSLGVPPSADGEPGPLSADSIAHCLLHFAPKVLLLVDHLDEVQWLYRPGEDVAGTGGVGPARARHVKELIDFALTFPNGIITGRDESVSPAWMAARGFSRRVELAGMTTANVAQYIENYFRAHDEAAAGSGRPSREAVRDALLREVAVNPELMTLAQVPVHAAALCLIWEDEVLAASAVKTTSITLLYYRVVVWFARRLTMRVKLKSNQRPGFSQVLSSCRRELSALGAIAYASFVHHESPSISAAAVRAHCGDDHALYDSVTKEMGLLRTRRAGEAPTATFHLVHVTYLEFFVAYHIVELLRGSYAPVGSPATPFDMRKEVQQATRAIIMDEHPRNRMVKLFLSGLVSMPAVAYADSTCAPGSRRSDSGSEIFWGACIEVTRPLLSPCIGLHPAVCALMAHVPLLREAMLTAEAFRLALEGPDSVAEAAALSNSSDLLSPAVSEYEYRMHCISLWRNVCSMPALLPIFDFDIALNKSTQNAHRQHEAHRRQLFLDRERFGLYVPPQVSPCTLLLAIDSWSEAVETIRAQARSGDSDTRVACAEALGYVHVCDEASVGLLLSMLGDSYWDVRRAAAEALGRTMITGSLEIISCLRSLLDDVYPVRIAAAEALGHILSESDKSASSERALHVASLQCSVKDKDWVVRSASIDALCRIHARDVETVELFEWALTDSSEYVQRSAIHALECQQAESSKLDRNLISALHQRLFDVNKRVRLAAARALHSLHCGDNISKEVLKHSPTDHSYIFNLTAKDIKSFAALRNAAVKDMDREVRLAASEALKRIVQNDEETLAALRTDMKRKDWHVRVSATETVARMEAHDEWTLAALRDNLGDRSIEVKLAAAKALKHMATQLDTATIGFLLTYVVDSLAGDIGSGKYLQLSYELHLTLVRVTPLQLSLLFALCPERLSCALSLQLFVLSVWVHATSLLIEPQNELVLVNGQQVTLTGSVDELTTFANQLIEFEKLFLDSIDGRCSYSNVSAPIASTSSSRNDSDSAGGVRWKATMLALSRSVEVQRPRPGLFASSRILMS